MAGGLDGGASYPASVSLIIPELSVARRVTSTKYSDSITSWVGIGPSNTWVIAGVVVTAVFVLGFGLGISPEGYSDGEINVPPFFSIFTNR